MCYYSIVIEVFISWKIRHIIIQLSQAIIVCCRACFLFYIFWRIYIFLMIGSNQIGSLVFIGKEFLYLPHSLSHSVIIEPNLNKNFFFINKKNRLPKKKYHKAYKKAPNKIHIICCVLKQILKIVARWNYYSH